MYSTRLMDSIDHIHYDDYDVFRSRFSDFQRRVAEAGLEDRVNYLARSETYTFAGRPDAAPGRSA